MVNTLFLDIGFSKLGWAVSHDLTLLNYGTHYTTPKECNGERLHSIRIFLANTIFEYKIKDCLIELPVLVGLNGSNLNKVVGLVELECFINQITYRAISPKSMKLQLTGKGNASKDDVRFWVAKQVDVSKIPLKDLDTVDAIALFLVDRKNNE